MQSQNVSINKYITNLKSLEKFRPGANIWDHVYCGGVILVGTVGYPTLFKLSKTKNTVQN